LSGKKITRKSGHAGLENTPYGNFACFFASYMQKESKISMKKIISIMIAAIVIIVLSGCNQSNGNAPSMPDNFNFKIEFGTYGRNRIDTYNDSFTKDLVSAGTETIDFIIPNDKMQEIYAEFVKYDISGLPNNINAEVKKYIEGEIYMEWTPSSRYSLTYTCNDEARTIVCEDGGPWYESGPPDSRNRLVAFVDFISQYICSTEEYQNMPPIEGGYE